MTLEVKPWDDETDMEALEKSVRSVEQPGLVWGSSKLVAVGYGIKKLQITLVIEDELVSLDELQDKLAEFEDYVQSSDVAAMQSEFLYTPFTNMLVSRTVPRTVSINRSGKCGLYRESCVSCRCNNRTVNILVLEYHDGLSKQSGPRVNPNTEPRAHYGVKTLLGKNTNGRSIPFNTVL